MNTMQTSSQDNMYIMKYDIENLQNIQNLNNKLLATFTLRGELEQTLEDIQRKYKILYNNIFVFKIEGSKELVITYNIDYGNINTLPENSILVHRKKETNSLYTLNGLNEIVKSSNNGKLDPKFPVNWDNYRNSIILTQEGELKVLEIKIYDIIKL